MYAVSLLLKNSGLSQSFYFKAFKNADECFRKVFSSTEAMIRIEDDFNARGTFLHDSISAVSFSDIEEDMKRNGEMQIIQHKATLRTQQLAKGDPTLAILNNSSKLVGVN